MKLATKVKSILKRQEKLDLELRVLQDVCLHEKATKEYKSSDHWDRATDYWIQWECPECRKRWTTPQ